MKIILVVYNNNKESKFFFLSLSLFLESGLLDAQSVVGNLRVNISRAAVEFFKHVDLLYYCCGLLIYMRHGIIHL